MLRLTSPVRGAGFSSIESGILFFNLVPLGAEFALSRRIGLSVETELIYELSRLRNDLSRAAFTVGLPVYFQAAGDEMAYRGFFLKPMVSGGAHLTQNAPFVGAGAGLGYAWQTKIGLQIVLGLDLMATVSHTQMTQPWQVGFATGLQLSLGHWFF